MLFILGHKRNLGAVLSDEKKIYYVPHITGPIPFWTHLTEQNAPRVTTPSKWAHHEQNRVLILLIAYFAGQLLALANTL